MSESTMNYEWKEPQKTNRRGVQLVTPELLGLLKSNPGKWLSIGLQTRTSWARSVERLHKNQIELISRNNKGHKAEIFLRWIADQNSDTQTKNQREMELLRKWGKDE